MQPMNTFLQSQHVKNEGLKNKALKKWLRRVQRISLVILVWSLFVGFIFGFYSLLFERGIFVVKHIEVDGAFVHLTNEDVYKLAGINIGENLFSVDLQAVQKRIAENPWVKEAAVARKIPGTIWIYVCEYTPFALLVLDDIYLVDSSGVAFKQTDGREDKNLPAITGLSGKTGVGEAIGFLNTYLKSPLARYFTPAEINIDDVRGISIVLAGEGIVIRFGFDKVEEKLNTLYSMIGAMSKNKMRYIDLNIPGKVVVKYEEG